MLNVLKSIIRKTFSLFGISPLKIYHYICRKSLIVAIKKQKLEKTVEVLRGIVPDISKQESGESYNIIENNSYLEIKIRGMHAFQCMLMLHALKHSKRELAVADIGDSAGTHMAYLKKLLEKKYDIETISVNLDPRAISRIIKRGGNAICKRAEDIEPSDVGRNIDLFTSFEMVEHLHNPALFFRRIAKKHQCKKILITVPFLRKSRVGLHYVRSKSKDTVYAEDVHVFELCPEDWELLLLHSGWKVSHSAIYYQYPNNVPLISLFLRWLWKYSDYEGFLGIVLEKNTKYSELYKDWEE